MTPSRITGIVVACLLLQACATRQSLQLPDIDDWQTRQSVLGDLREWEFKGRIAVKAGDEGFNGGLHFAEDNNRFAATVSGPLGIGTVRLTGDGRRVSLTDKDGVVTELQDAETELRERYGWTIPVASLRYWALGIPDPATPAETGFDDDGLLASIVQGGWSVTISQYRMHGNDSGQQMPRRITATSEDVRVRLVIDRWTFFKLQ